MILVLGTKTVGSVTIVGGQVSAGKEGDNDSVDAFQLIEVCVLKIMILFYNCSEGISTDLVVQ